MFNSKNRDTNYTKITWFKTPLLPGLSFTYYKFGDGDQEDVIFIRYKNHWGIEITLFKPSKWFKDTLLWTTAYSKTPSFNWYLFTFFGDIVFFTDTREVETYDDEVHNAMVQRQLFFDTIDNMETLTREYYDRKKDE